MSGRAKWIVAGVLAALGLILVVQNTEIIEVRVLFWSFQMSRVILMLLMALVGFVCGFVLARTFQVERRKTDRGIDDRPLPPI